MGDLNKTFIEDAFSLIFVQHLAFTRRDHRHFTLPDQSVFPWRRRGMEEAPCSRDS
jgi:hypothetical protein